MEAMQAHLRGVQRKWRDYARALRRTAAIGQMRVRCALLGSSGVQTALSS